MKKIIFLSFLLLSLHSFPKGQSIDEWIEYEINSFNEEEHYFLKKEQGPWLLDKIRLRIRPLFGVELPTISSLEIKPFIEFHWKRSKP